MLSQCTNCDRSDKDDLTPVSKQHHRPISFHSGKFASTQLNWHISQKELYPIIFSFKRLPYMMFGHPRRITVFTYHKNLEHVLNPEWSPETAYIDRLIRWGLMLQNADICVRHVSGDDNFVADILCRWGNQFHEDKAVNATNVFHSNSRTKIGNHFSLVKKSAFRTPGMKDCGNGLLTMIYSRHNKRPLSNLG